MCRKGCPDDATRPPAPWWAAPPRAWAPSSPPRGAWGGAGSGCSGRAWLRHRELLCSAKSQDSACCAAEVRVHRGRPDAAGIHTRATDGSTSSAWAPARQCSGTTRSCGRPANCRLDWRWAAAHRGRPPGDTTWWYFHVPGATNATTASGIGSLRPIARPCSNPRALSCAGHATTSAAAAAAAAAGPAATCHQPRTASQL